MRKWNWLHGADAQKYVFMLCWLENFHFGYAFFFFIKIENQLWIQLNSLKHKSEWYELNFTFCYLYRNFFKCDGITRVNPLTNSGFIIVLYNIRLILLAPASILAVSIQIRSMCIRSELSFLPSLMLHKNCALSEYYSLNG